MPRSHRRAAVMQASLAAVGLVSSIAAWLAGASFLWVVAGVLLGSVIPFTSCGAKKNDAGRNPPDLHWIVSKRIESMLVLDTGNVAEAILFGNRRFGVLGKEGTWR